MRTLLKPKKAPFKIKLDEQLYIDRVFYYIEVTMTNNKPGGIVRVWNNLAEKYVKVNERGFFRANKKQLEQLKSKCYETDKK